MSEVGNSKLDSEEVFEEIVSLLHCYSMKLYSKRDTIIDINKCISAIDEYRSASEVYNEYYEQPPISIGHSKELSNSLKGCYHYKSINLKTGKELTEKENNLYCQYIRNMHAFEQKKWEEIWDRIKEHGQKFWD